MNNNFPTADSNYYIEDSISVTDTITDFIRYGDPTVSIPAFAFYIVIDDELTIREYGCTHIDIPSNIPMNDGMNVPLISINKEIYNNIVDEIRDKNHITRSNYVIITGLCRGYWKGED